MSDWTKDKGLPPWAVGKDQSFQAIKGSGLWEFEKSPDKYEYNVGSDIKTSEEPVWGLDQFSTIPITDTHIPCGYWFDEPRYDPFLLTSKVYPILAFDPDELSDYSIDVIANFISGDFRAIIRDYDMGYENIDVTGTMTAGNFHSYATILWTYQYEESLDIESALTSGEFHNVIIIIHSYEYGENLDVESTLSSGVFRKAVITDDKGLPDSLDIESALTGGTYGTP